MVEESSRNKKNKALTQRVKSSFKGSISTSSDFKRLMASLMKDLLEDRITPGVAGAVCNAGGKLLKVVEMEMKAKIKGHQTGLLHLNGSDKK